MPNTVEQLNPTRAKLTIELPFSDLKPALDKAYKQIAKSVNIPGFRKGHVPNKLIDQRFGRGAVLQEAINEALPQAFADAVRETGIVPLGEPEIEVTKLEDGELVEFTVEVDVRPEFELPDFSAVSVELESIEVTEEEVNERLDLLRERFATLKDLDRPAADGDIVVLDLKAWQGDEAVSDADATGLNYRIGSGGMIEGLDEAVTGLSAGESKRFPSKLVGGPQKDEDVEIEVTITKVQEQELPEVDDEFAQLASEFDTAEEMIAALRENLERVERVNQANDARDRVLEKVVALTDFELPQALVAAEVAGRRAQIEQQFAQAGLSLEEYLEQAADEEAEDEGAFWASIEKRSIEALRAQMILDKLSDSEEIAISNQDLTELIMAKAQQNGTSPEQEANHMFEHNHMNDWVAEIRRGKALGMIVSRATVTDSTGAAVDLSKLRSDGTIAEPEAEEAAVESPREAETGQPAVAAEQDEPAEPAKKASAKKATAKSEPEATAVKEPAKKTSTKKAAAE